ncbi:hypothetical protein [Thiobacillus sp.]|uniref:hypothetical protein n=1 Tax=Thiobacillus sp. TaxID=924 RepID=UPI0025D010FC|nr:hypothetical protein [Thiobacillus sp.]MBT9540141.1 hypothetical protein [Thiobacillus sp.]
MSQLVERISGHQIFAELTEFANALELAKEASSQEQAPLDNWDRANAVAAYVRRTLDQVDPLLVVPGNLANMATYLLQARSEINSFVSNKNIGHWNNAQTYLDNCLAQLAAFPRQTAEGIDDLRDVASTFRTVISGWLDAIKKDSEGISQMLGALQTRIAEAIAEINTQKQRLDTAISTHQQQFSDAQQARQTEFASAEQARTVAAAKSEETRQTEFEEAEGERAEAEKQAAAEAAKIHSEIASQLRTDGNTVITELKGQKAHAEKLIGIITDTGMAYGYQKTANEERSRAALWKFVAAGSMVVWIVIGVIFFYFTYDKDLTWPTVIRQMLISTPFILLAGFAALQVSRHQKNERGLRQSELELASIDPFLATLTDDERNTVKREFATRHFGHREADTEHDAADPKIAENLLAMAKALQEIQQAIRR